MTVGASLVFGMTGKMRSFRIKKRRGISYVAHGQGLSPDQRVALEGLLGRRLSEDEGLSIQPSRVLKEAPTGEERARAYRDYLANCDKIAQRADGVSDEELDAAIEEACHQIRHP